MSLEVFVEVGMPGLFSCVSAAWKDWIVADPSTTITEIFPISHFFLSPFLFPVLLWGLSGFFPFLSSFIFLLLGNRIMGGIGGDGSGWPWEGKRERTRSDRIRMDGDMIRMTMGWVDDGMKIVLV